MFRSFTSAVRGKSLIVFAVLFLLTAAAVSPVFFVSEAQVRGRGLQRQTKSHENALPNYDIRSDKAAYNKIAELRQQYNRSASDVADKLDEAVQGEEELRSKVPNLKVVYGPHSRMPEVIAPDEKYGQGKADRCGRRFQIADGETIYRGESRIIRFRCGAGRLR